MYAYVRVCTYACMYVCMYVCMYIRMHVCMYVCNVCTLVYTQRGSEVEFLAQGLLLGSCISCKSAGDGRVLVSGPAAMRAPISLE
jgi:hypothetical protein